MLRETTAEIITKIKSTDIKCHKMSCKELQSEEIEVLEYVFEQIKLRIMIKIIPNTFTFYRSIYDGDPCFSKNEENTFQYKYGEDGASKSFILELIWGSEYPENLPEVSLEAFYNKHIFATVKDHIIHSVKTEAEQYLGMSMTYTIFEYVKENLDTLLADQPVEIIQSAVSDLTEKLTNADLEEDQDSSKNVKKEQLTKAQKRRMWNRGGLDTDDRPRGWNWVDIVRHLSQTGGQS